jgi:hypothetical protein
MLVVLVIAGAALHDVTTHSSLAKLLWLGGVVAVVGYPLHYLLSFKCPRCGAPYLATGRLGDFLGLGRVLWAQRCGSCSLPAGDVSAGLTDTEGPAASSARVNGELPDARHAASRASRLARASSIARRRGS